jgi:polyhydroxyalkanoate synthesis repressor PhaR
MCHGWLLAAISPAAPMPRGIPARLNGRARTSGQLRGVLRCVMLHGIQERVPVPMAAIRIIKKYPNRRLYDTEISSYITIEDVRQLIVDGEDFEVRDAKTGEDLTRSVLLQIIAEHEQDGEPVLSTQLLSQIIRFYGDSLQGFMGNYLERSMQIFLEQQSQFRSQMGNLLGQTPWSMMNQLTERNLEIWQEFQRNLTSGLGRTTGPAGKPQEPPPQAAPKTGRSR